MEANVDALANDPIAIGVIGSVARQQRKRRRRAYDEMALFTHRDLEQELWLSLLIEERRGRLISSFVIDEGCFRDYVLSLAEVIAQRGIRKANYGHSIPVGSLTKQDKAKLWHKQGYSLEATFDELYEKQEYWS